MCFSAEASFTIGAVLTGLGIATLKKKGDTSRLLIALIPLLFALQQFSEGVVWLNINGTIDSQAGVVPYLFFAWILWPTYIPIAYFVAESVTWKRVVCVLCLLIGLYISFVDIMYLATHTVIPRVLGHTLYYDHSLLHDNLVYGFVIMTPVFLSSIPKMWIFAVFLLIAFIISQTIYALTFTSVWCFFAAAASLLLLQILSQTEPTAKDYKKL